MFTLAKLVTGFLPGLQFRLLVSAQQEFFSSQLSHRTRPHMFPFFLILFICFVCTIWASFECRLFTGVPRIGQLGRPLSTDSFLLLYFLRLLFRSVFTRWNLPYFWQNSAKQSSECSLVYISRALLAESVQLHQNSVFFIDENNVWFCRLGRWVFRVGSPWITCSLIPFLFRKLLTLSCISCIYRSKHWRRCTHVFSKKWRFWPNAWKRTRRLRLRLPFGFLRRYLPYYSFFISVLYFV